MRRITLYLLSLACAIVYGLSLALGDSWGLFGLLAFALLVIAIVADRDLGHTKQ